MWHWAAIVSNCMHCGMGQIPSTSKSANFVRNSSTPSLTFYLVDFHDTIANLLDEAVDANQRKVG